MNESSTIYWSSLKSYEDCPQHLLWSKGWDGIDLGAGPGRPKPKPVIVSPRHHAVMGIVIQYAIEKMYNDELWRSPKTLQSLLLEIIDREWSKQESDSRNQLDYRNIEMTRSELLQTCRDGVLNYLKTMQAHRFLGPYSKGEVDLIGWVDKYTQVGGRADMIIRRDDTGVTILDGKNTKHRESPDPDQLRWYALLFKLSYRQLPDRLAFVWYRFPFNSEANETGITWVPFTEEDVKALADRVIKARLSMRKELFAAAPTPTKCRNCDFQTVCPERIAQRAINSAKRAPRSPQAAKTPIGVSSPDEDGFTDFSM